MSDKTPLEQLVDALSKRPSIMVCWSKCESCKWGEHPGVRHSWADSEDIAWAKQQGQPDPSKSICGCHCQRTYRTVYKRPRQLIHKGGKP